MSRLLATATSRSGRFGLAVAGAVVLGLAVRAVYALWLGGPDERLGGDAQLFRLLAQRLADGEGYLSGPNGGLIIETADKPPLFPLVLAAASKVGLSDIAGHRIVSTVLSTATIVPVALLGRRLAGPPAGVLAALVCAVYPPLWVIAGTVMSESLYGLLIALVLLAALWTLDAPSLRRAAVLGALIGAAALTRSEAVGLLVLLVLPVAWRAPASGWRLAGVAALACALVLAPWIVRNALTFERFVPLSTNAGVLAGANCPSTYSGEGIGLWDQLCVPPRSSTDDSVQAARNVERGLDYAREHADRVPLVVAARLARSAGLWDPWQQAELTDGILEGRDTGVARAGVIAFYVLVIAAVGGAVVLWRRGSRDELLVLAAPVVLVVLTVAASYGAARFRVPAEIALVALAGVALDAVGRRIRARDRAAAAVG